MPILQDVKNLEQVHVHVHTCHIMYRIQSTLVCVLIIHVKNHSILVSIG